MTAGELVLVTEFGGRKVVRRVVADRGESAVVRDEKEYLSAAQAGRRPKWIGFRREAVEEIQSEGAT
jgi:hypothetical protein